MRFLRRRPSTRKDYRKSSVRRRNQKRRKRKRFSPGEIVATDSVLELSGSKAKRIHLHREGQTYGPYSLESLLHFVEEGRASEQDWAWRPGLDRWISLEELLPEIRGETAGKSWLSEALEKIDAMESEESRLEIIEWACEQCGLKPLETDARRMYVTDDSGERHLCAHPLEYSVVEKHLGPNVPDHILRESTGYEEDHFCPACLKISLLDPDKDPMVCPKCGKRGIKRGIEFANQSCPGCRGGTIIGKPMETGFIDEIIRSAHAKEQEVQGWN